MLLHSGSRYRQALGQLSLLETCADVFQFLNPCTVLGSAGPVFNVQQTGPTETEHGTGVKHLFYTMQVSFSTNGLASVTVPPPLAFSISVAITG